jgi:hypothetical protein
MELYGGDSLPRNILAVCIFFLFTTTIIGCSQTDSNEFVVPSEYSHAKDMLDNLNKQGIEIQEINNSLKMALFQTKPNYAMFIKSDSGIFELIHLEKKNGKDFTIENKGTEGSDGNFKYTLMKNGKDAQLIDSNEVMYFYKNDEYIAITNEKELSEKLKKIFK